MKNKKNNNDSGTTKGYIFDIKKFAVHDGPGIRTTVFFKGCPLNCWWCHNPESREMKPQVLLNYPNRYQQEIVGRIMTLDDVMKEIMKDWIFYEESGEGGVTFSGGEPLLQPKFLTKLVNACYNAEIDSSLDTSGYASWFVIKGIMDKISLFLYDIKLINDKEHQKYTGVSNKKILENLSQLDSEGKRVIIRFPVIPGITDTTRNINQIKQLLDSLISINEIHLLPYHKIGNPKYKKLGCEYRLQNLPVPTNERLEELEDYFNESGIKVKLGG